MEETCSVVGIPVMTRASFVHTERDIGELGGGNCRNQGFKLGEKRGR